MRPQAFAVEVSGVVVVVPVSLGEVGLPEVSEEPEPELPDEGLPELGDTVSEGWVFVVIGGP
jgi:hypothetical protein